MASYFSFNSLSSSIVFSTNHLRSFCLSFFCLATIFTLINFLATSTSVNKLTTNEYTSEQFSTKTIRNTSSISLLSLSAKDFRRYHRFKCDEQRYQRREKINTSTTIELIQPRKTSFNENIIPYDYNTWQSTSIMPRMVSKCEHRLMMELLRRFDQLTKKYSLEYMMTDGTLLGNEFLFVCFFDKNSSK